jgi:hypothetical protein
MLSHRSLLRNGAIIMMASILTLTACKKKSDNNTTTLTNADDNGGYASDAAKLDQNSNDAMSISDAAATTGSSNLRTTSGYPLVTRVFATPDTVITIDFGPINHICLDGKNRRGQIIVTYSGRYKDSGSTHAITTSNYYVDDNKVIFHKTVTNVGAIGSGPVSYNVTVNDSIILGTDSVIYWTGNRTRTWSEGYGTTTWTDDVYLIGGVTTLHRANGKVFTFTISVSDPLKVALGCRYIEAGTVTISSTSFTGGDRTLNYTYGPTSGGCDNEAAVTIGAHTYHITLH